MKLTRFSAELTNTHASNQLRFRCCPRVSCSQS